MSEKSEKQEYEPRYHCENCGNGPVQRYIISRMYHIPKLGIEFRFGKKHIEKVCLNCVNDTVYIFVNKSHSVDIVLEENKC